MRNRQRSIHFNGLSSASALSCPISITRFIVQTEVLASKDCELLGPAHIFVINSVIKNSGFWDCEVVLAKDGASVIGVTGFADCYFDRCNFFRVTLYMTKETYQAMKANGAAPPVISDGKAGDL
jgi:hypothetical protein